MRFFEGVINGIIASIFLWGFIYFMGYIIIAFIGYLFIKLK